MFNILLIVGHGENTSGGFDPGAVGNGFQEHERMIALAEQLKGRIINANVDVLDTRWSWSNRIKNGIVPDFSKYNYVVELHMNASTSPNANGSMIYIDQSETGHSVEDAILKHLYEVGYAKAWDGVVVTQRQFPGGLIVQNAVRRAGVSHALIETCFITNKADMDRFNTMLAQTAQAIADGIIEGFGLNKTVTITKPVENKPVEEKKPDFAQSFAGSVAGKYKVISSDGLNMRYKPGEISNDNIILTIPADAEVQCFGYYTNIGGIKWLYVSYKGTEGFASGAYLKKL